MRHRDKAVSNAQRKDQRGRQKKLVAVLDAVIPVQSKRRASWNGAGAFVPPAICALRRPPSREQHCSGSGLRHFHWHPF